jgi:(E)-4-hydroxy-3-methylbut-2-enyl-diphosphate synthase
MTWPGRSARETDVGLTGDGNGTHQIYLSGLTARRLEEADIVDHLIALVEKKPPKSKPRSAAEEDSAFATAQ